MGFQVRVLVGATTAFCGIKVGNIFDRTYNSMEEKEIGKVIHYFDKAGVAVVRLSDALKTGDTIKFKRENDEFTEIVSSMQVDHAQVTSGKSGDEVAIKISKKTKEGVHVYKVEG